MNKIDDIMVVGWLVGQTVVALLQLWEILIKNIGFMLDLPLDFCCFQLTWPFLHST
jgi:hypothetical protein